MWNNLPGTYDNLFDDIVPLIKDKNVVMIAIHFLISRVNKVNGDVPKFNQVLKRVNDEVHLFNYDVINVIAYDILVVSYENVVRRVDILGNNDIFNCSIYFDHFLIETLNPLGKVIKIPVDKRDRFLNLPESAVEVLNGCNDNFKG
jgi:hypothetical protein